MKAVASTLGVARSNPVERVKGGPTPRGSYRKIGDTELIARIRPLVGRRPSYGYRRITALLNNCARWTISGREHTMEVAAASEIAHDLVRCPAGRSP